MYTVKTAAGSVFSFNTCCHLCITHLSLTRMLYVSQPLLQFQLTVYIVIGLWADQGMLEAGLTYG